MVLVTTDGRIQRGYKMSELIFKNLKRVILITTNIRKTNYKIQKSKIIGYVSYYILLQTSNKKNSDSMYTLLNVWSTQLISLDAPPTLVIVETLNVIITLM